MNRGIVPTIKLLLAEIPRVYRPDFHYAPGPEMTFYRVFAGPAAVFDGTKRLSLKTDFPNIDNTILVIEAGEPVPWTKPESLTFGPDAPLPSLGARRIWEMKPFYWRTYQPDVFSAVMVDGSIKSLPVDLPPAQLQAMIVGKASPGTDQPKRTVRPPVALDQCVQRTVRIRCCREGALPHAKGRAQKEPGNVPAKAYSPEHSGLQ